MKKINRTRVLPQNSRLDKHNVAKQHEFFAKRQQIYVQNALKASGIYCVIFKLTTGGKRCTCGGHASLLDSNGDLTEKGLLSISQSVQNLYAGSNRVTFKANDLNLEEDLGDLEEEFEDIDPTELDLLDYGSFNQDYCGICYGSGYVGGYYIQPGFRQVYDVQSVINTDFNLDKTVQPYVYKDGTFADFLVRVPKHTKANIRLFNNTEQVEFLHSEIPNGTEGTITIKTKHEFTHIEITELKGFISTDFAQLPENFGADLLGTTNTAIFILDHRTSINGNSIIYETKFGRLWQVNQINPFYDNSGILIQYEVEARLVAQHELYKHLMGVK